VDVSARYDTKFPLRAERLMLKDFFNPSTFFLQLATTADFS
jgi:hypothetical protein